MDIPNAEPEVVTRFRVAKRWRGMGAILFVLFYSVYFAAHVRLADSVVYLKDDSLASAQTASVFTSLITERGSTRTAAEVAHPLFTVLHQPATQLAIRGWERFSPGTNSARKHAVAFLTAGAAALSVALLYQGLLWMGVSMGRAALFACAQGGSTMAAVWASVPEVWVFAGLGMVAMFWAVARAEQGQWWELPLACFYAVGCWIWLVVPAVFLMLVAAFRERGPSSWLGRAFSVLGSLLLLGSMLLASGTLQRVLFPTTGQVWQLESLQKEVLEAFDFAIWDDVDEVKLRALGQSAVFTSMVAPEAVVKERPLGKAGPVRRSVSFQDDRWLQMDFHHAVWGAWALVLLISAVGGLVMMRHQPAMMLVLFAMTAFMATVLLFYRIDLERALFGGLVTPIIVALAAAGLEGGVRIWRALGWPFGALMVVFVAAQVTRNWQLVLELDELLKL